MTRQLMFAGFVSLVGTWPAAGLRDQADDTKRAAIRVEPTSPAGSRPDVDPSGQTKIRTIYVKPKPQ